MGNQLFDPIGLNLLGIAERIYHESQILHRLDDILRSPNLEHLEACRVEQIQRMFIAHVDLMGSAHAEWRLPNSLLEECVAYVALTGPGPKCCQDLILIQETEELLEVFSHIEGILKQAEAFLNEIKADDADNRGSPAEPPI